jgi:tetratricopeptide (TPR) repeat protein
MYLNFGAPYIETEEYDDAFSYCEKALEIFRCHYLADHCLIGKCYCNLGVNYCRWKEYDLSLYYLEKSLEIISKTMPTHHEEIGAVYLNIGEVFEGISFYNIALSYYERANEIFHNASISSEHDAMIELQRQIQSAKIKLIAHLGMLNK